MKVARFRVATCEGYAISGNLASRPSGAAHPGLSATVCDTLHLWRGVKTYRSEDRGYFAGALGRRGRERTLRDAEDHAAHLNREHARELHTEAVRAGRAKVRERG